MRKLLWIPVFAMLGFLAAPVVSAEAAPATKEWTILVFLNGFNNLDSFGSKDINEMEQVGSSSNVNVVVQWASLKTKDARRLLVQKDNDTKNVTSPIVQNIGQVDMGDYRSLVDFVQWAKTNYPAKHYMIDIWNHGAGWHFADEKPITRGISYDDLSGNHITTEQLGQAMRESAQIIGHKVDLYGSDACLMAMGEIAGQMKDDVGVFVGSEETEPGDGWPYQTFLAPVVANPQMSALDVAKNLSKAYVDSYANQSQITMSVFDLSKYDVLKNAVRDLGAAIVGQDSATKTAILGAASKAVSFAYSDYKDLGDFVALASPTVKDAGSRAAFDATSKAIKQFVVDARASKDYARTTGLSIWLPEFTYDYDFYEADYDGLAFAQETNWKDALKALLGK